MIAEHMGIAVKDIKQWESLYRIIFPNALYKEEVVSAQGVRILFVEGSNLKIELLEPLDESSTVHKFLEKRGEGFHHIAFLVDDIEMAMKDYKEAGIHFLYEEPRIGAEGFLVNFFSPKETKGILTELCQKP